jgi:WD40 repeat protein
MRSYLLAFSILLLCGVSARAQAPLCSEVLHNVQEHINPDGIIENLAHIKMSLDIAKSQGKYSTTQKKLASDFNTRMSELIKVLKLEMSEKEIRSLVQEKILDLQKSDKVNSAKENEARQQQDKILKAYPLLKRINLNIESTPDVIDHIPELNSLVYHDLGAKKLYLFNLETEKASLLDFGVYQYILQGPELFIVTTNGNILVRSLDDGGKITGIAKQVSPKSNISISPSSEWMVATHESQISIFNISSGKDAPGILKLPESEKIIDYVTFVSKTEILIGRTRDQNIYLFDVVTGKLQTFATGMNSLRQAHVSASGQILFTTSNSEIISLHIADLANFSTKAEHFPGNFQAVKFMPDSESVYIKYVDDAIQRGIFSAASIKHPNYTFPTLPLGGAENSSSSPAFDIQGKKIYTGGRHKNPNGSVGYHIDVWNEVSE